MAGRTRVGIALALTLAAGAASPACSSKEPSHPNELGPCIATPDASCGTLGGSSGGASPPRGDGSANVDTGLSDAGPCGMAATQISTMNVDCVPCIEEGLDGGQNCCLVDFACSEIPGCSDLLGCVERCGANDTTCVSQCESNTSPNAITAYNDFAECIAISCSPECPELPQTTAVDP